MLNILVLNFQGRYPICKMDFRAYHTRLIYVANSSLFEVNFNKTCEVSRKMDLLPLWS